MNKVWPLMHQENRNMKEFLFRLPGTLGRDPLALVYNRLRNNYRLRYRAWTYPSQVRMGIMSSTWSQLARATEYVNLRPIVLI